MVCTAGSGRSMLLCPAAYGGGDTPLLPERGYLPVDGTENYREVLGNTAFRLAAANTLKFTAVCIPLLVVCSLLLAVLLQRMKQAGKLLKRRFSAAGGGAGSFCGAGVEDAVSFQRAAERTAGGDGRREGGLDDHRGGLLGAGAQLSLEKPGVRYGAVDGGPGRNPPGNL